MIFILIHCQQHLNQIQFFTVNDRINSDDIKELNDLINILTKKMNISRTIHKVIS